MIGAGKDYCVKNMDIPCSRALSAKVCTCPRLEKKRRPVTLPVSSFYTFFIPRTYQQRKQFSRSFSSLCFIKLSINSVLINLFIAFLIPFSSLSSTSNSIILFTSLELPLDSDLFKHYCFRC
ncbi:hypothetical protein X975_23905, partial [Stegodyphus mimosarum]